MRESGVGIQVISCLIGIGGAIAGVVTLSQRREEHNGLEIILASLLAWILLFGIGKAFERLQDIAENTRRSAEAQERSAQALMQIVNRQTAASPPAQPPMRPLRDLTKTPDRS